MKYNTSRKLRLNNSLTHVACSFHWVRRWATTWISRVSKVQQKGQQHKNKLNRRCPLQSPNAPIENRRWHSFAPFGTIGHISKKKSIHITSGSSNWSHGSDSGAFNCDLSTKVVKAALYFFIPRNTQNTPLRRRVGSVLALREANTWGRKWEERKSPTSNRHPQIRWLTSSMLLGSCRPIFGTWKIPIRHVKKKKMKSNIDRHQGNDMQGKCKETDGQEL